MENSIFSKIYAGFSIVYCLLMSLIGLMTIVVPIYDYGFTPLDENGQFLYHTISAVLTMLVFTPQPIALMSFYFSGAIGKNWFSHIVFGLLILSFLTLVLLILYVIYLQISGIPEFYFATKKLQPLERFKIPIALFGFLHTWFFTIIFTVTALTVRKVSLGKRLLPLFAVFSAIFAAIIFAAAIIAIGTISGSQSIYNGYKEATIPHWFMLGSLAWSLIGFAVFRKTVSKPKELDLPISTNNFAENQELKEPVISTFAAQTGNQKSNKKLYLILGGIAAVILLASFSIVALAAGVYFLKEKPRPFEGKPNTNQTAKNINTNQPSPAKRIDLKTLLESKKNWLANFKLYNVNKSEAKFFPYPTDKIYAMFYSEQNRAKLTFIDVSVFKNIGDASKEIEFKKKIIAEQKLKISSEEKNDNGIVIHFKNKEYFEVFECRDEVCFSVRDKSESDLTTFRAWILKEIVPEAIRSAKNN